MSVPPARSVKAKAAGSELLCLQIWEQHAGWLIEHTAKWPKSSRFSLVQKVDGHVLEILELLVVARYEPADRRLSLKRANLKLEQLRFLLRVAHARGIENASGFEKAMRGIDELGRMLHGWRQALCTTSSEDPA